MSPNPAMNPEIAPHILTGKCRYRDETLKLDRILCVDAPGDYPVKTLTADGCPINHRANGQSPAGKCFDLLPLAPGKRAAREWWITVDKDGGRITGPCGDRYVPCDLREKVRVREVLPEQEEPSINGKLNIDVPSLKADLKQQGREDREMVGLPAFKVGDRVVTHEFNSSGFVPWMREFVGKAGRIVLRSPSGNFLVHRFWWPASALTLVEEPAPESEPEFRYFKGIWYELRMPTSGDSGSYRKPGDVEWSSSTRVLASCENDIHLTETDAAGVPLEEAQQAVGDLY